MRDPDPRVNGEGLDRLNGLTNFSVLLLQQNEITDELGKNEQLAAYRNSLGVKR